MKELTKLKALAEGKQLNEQRLSYTAAAKKIFDKVKGTPNLKLGSLKKEVRKYLDMVGMTSSDIDYLTAEVWTKLEDAGLV